VAPIPATSARTLIAERGRSADGSHACNRLICVEGYLTPINMFTTQIGIFWRPSLAHRLNLNAIAGGQP
jgi:hypothetical protein